MVITDNLDRQKHSVDFKRGAGNEKVPCPLCSHERKKSRDPSLSWTHEEQRGLCHHCGAKFFVDMEEKPKLKEKTEPLPPLNNTQLTEKTFEYFRQRAISSVTIKRNYITEGERYIPQIGAKRNCIWFNYFLDGHHVNTKFRDGAKNFTQIKGADKYFYGLDDIKDSEAVIIVEGEMDKLSFEEAGFKNCISVPDGALQPNQSYSQKKLEYIANSYDYLKDKEAFYLATDNDEPGRALREELARRLGKHRCYLVDLQQYKDANQALLNEGLEFLAGALDHAREYPIEGVVTFSQIKDDIVDLYENGLQQKAKTGLPEFDKHASLEEGMLSLITGIPTHGKSSFLDQLMVLLAQQGFKFGVYSPEHDIRLHFQRLARILIGKQFFGGQDQMSREDLEFAIEFLSDKIYSIRPDGDDQSLDRILEVSREVVARHGVSHIVIDPWNSLAHGYENEHKFAKEALTKLNTFKLQYNVHINIVAHPRKMKKKENGYFEVPTAYDIAESSHFANKLDLVMCIYRNFIEKVTECRVQKVKFEGILGQSGQVDFSYDTITNRFTEIESNFYPGGAVPAPEPEQQETLNSDQETTQGTDEVPF